MSDELLLFRNFAIALFIGALVGIEREKRRERETAGLGGLRTFILFAEAGAVAAWLSRTFDSPWVLAAGLVAVTLLVAAAYVLDVRRDVTAAGATTEVAAVVVFLLGAVAVAGGAEIAVALAIVTSAVLAFKKRLHEAVGRLDYDDLVAALKLLFATFIVLPLLPRHPVDPWGVLNPYKLWVLVILISALSLAGYVAVRLLGPERGAALTGLAGGLVSSTAVTLAFARRSREEPGHALAAGVLLAWAVMFARVLVLVAVARLDLLLALLRPVLLMGGVVALCAALALRAGRGRSVAGASVPVRNPFSLSSAIRFGLFFAAILLVVELARRYVSAEGLYLVALLAGTTDVDAITLSMGRMAGTEIGVQLAARAIVVAALANTLVKCAMALTGGRGEFARRVGVATGAVVAVAGLSAVLGWL